jgi:ABC-2 type transport system permease protein
MAGNSEFQPAANQGLLAGFGNLFRAEMRSWWRTRTWWIQTLIWVGAVDGLLLTIISSGVEGGLQELAPLYGVFGGLFTAVAVIIIVQGAVVGEKIDGTAAWVLSKPVSRAAFLLAKWLGNAIGIAVTMVLAPGLLAFLVFTQYAGLTVRFIDFAAGMGTVLLFNLFWLSLTLMLGAFFSARGAVIGIPMALLLGQQFFAGAIMQLSERILEFLPYALIMPDTVVPGQSLASQAIMGTPLATGWPIIATIILIVALTWFGIRRFEQEEL